MVREGRSSRPGRGDERGGGRSGAGTGSSGRSRGGAPGAGGRAGGKGAKTGGTGAGDARGPAQPETGRRSSAPADPPFSRARGDDKRFGPRRDDRRGRGRSGDQETRSAEQAAYDGPALDESITGKELDRSVAQQLRGLPEKLAARVARHLVAAGMLIDTDPRTAYQHTLAARGRAARIAVVREACGEAAYAAGEFAEALSELRAAKRMNGSQAYLAVMADCERALGRPDRALALARNPAVAGFEPALKAEMTIVEAGARRDLGELDAALRTLENAPLRSQSRAEWVARLRYAYADTLLAAGRTEEAVEWFHRTVAVDSDEVTDAAERVVELERR
jgi:tetratricopeptide (TPR) repeat protein